MIIIVIIVNIIIIVLAGLDATIGKYFQGDSKQLKELLKELEIPDTAFFEELGMIII